MTTMDNSELRILADGVLKAAMADDWTRMQAELGPLWGTAGADAGDAYLLIVMMVHVTLDSLPQGHCSEHGTACIEVKLAMRVGNNALISDEEELRERYPAEVAWLDMARAEQTDDPDASLRAFCQAVRTGLGPELLLVAIRNAADSFKRRVASLQ